MTRTGVVAILKDNQERYVFEFEVSQEGYKALCQALGRFAANPDLNFNWYDAAVLSQNGRRIVNEKDQRRGQ